MSAINKYLLTLPISIFKLNKRLAESTWILPTWIAKGFKLGDKVRAIWDDGSDIFVVTEIDCNNKVHFRSFFDVEQSRHYGRYLNNEIDVNPHASSVLEKALELNSWDFIDEWDSFIKDAAEVTK